LEVNGETDDEARTGSRFVIFNYVFETRLKKNIITFIRSPLGPENRSTIIPGPVPTNSAVYVIMARRGEEGGRNFENDASLNAETMADIFGRPGRSTAVTRNRTTTPSRLSTVVSRLTYGRTAATYFR